jgi:uncharacterized protein YpmB
VTTQLKLVVVVAVIVIIIIIIIIIINISIVCVKYVSLQQMREAGSRSLETVMLRSNLHCRLDMDYKLPTEVDFVCDEAFATAAVLRQETKDILCI